MKHRYSDDPTPAQQPLKKGWRKFVQLAVVALLSLVLIAGGTVGVLASNVLGKIDRTDISGNPSANFESTIGLVDDDEWIHQMLTELSEPSEPESAAPPSSAAPSAAEPSSAAPSSAPQVTSVPAASKSTASKATQAKDAVNSKITTAKTGYAKTHDLPLLSDPNVKNYLLIGADLAGIGDSTMIVSLNQSTGKIHLTSLMRAMYVNIPGRGWFLFNHAMAWGGPKLVIRTIEDNFRVKIDDYIVVNFNSFPRVIDAVGGVDLTLSKKEAAYMTEYGYPCQAGSVHMGGEMALIFARCRYTDSDFHRTNRQRNIIQSVMRKAMAMNPAELYTLAGELAGMVNTSMSNADILAMAAQVPNFVQYKIDQKMLPVENDTTGGRAAGFTGRIYIQYSKGSALRVEAYAVNYEKNVDALRKFILS